MTEPRAAGPASAVSVSNRLLIGTTRARPVVPATPPKVQRTAIDLPSRVQWNSNYGYCGETSFVSAGLYYGQYVSQYDARAAASRNMAQNLPASQLLLGVNDTAAAAAMHLNAVAFDTSRQTSTAAFLTWLKGNVLAGYPVAIGVFTNESRFYGTKSPTAGDPEYDHIVTVTGISSSRPLTTPVMYYTDDVITVSDHGLWTAANGSPQNSFTYQFGAFPANRRQANASTGPVYSLSNAGANYGVAITGIVDPNRETVPVRLSTSTDGETPSIVDGSDKRPPASSVALTITLTNLKPGVTYNLFRYDKLASVPESGFNANAANAAQKWTITASGSTHALTQTIMSNEVAVYRAVPATGP